MHILPILTFSNKIERDSAKQRMLHLSAPVENFFIEKLNLEKIFYRVLLSQLFDLLEKLVTRHVTSFYILLKTCDNCCHSFFYLSQNL